MLCDWLKLRIDLTQLFYDWWSIHFLQSDWLLILFQNGRRVNVYGIIVILLIYYYSQIFGYGTNPSNNAIFDPIITGTLFLNITIVPNADIIPEICDGLKCLAEIQKIQGWWDWGGDSDVIK